MSASPTLREWLHEAPWGLTMSSGFFAFFAHTGLLSVLEDEGLAFARVSGSSAGALTGAAWAAGVSAGELTRVLETLRREDFWDPSPGLGLLRGQRFRDKLESMLPINDLAATRVPTAVSVFEPISRKTHVLTAGPISAAIHASCAVPLLFHPVRIGARVYVDGGVADRPGLEGMPENMRVLYHHISSKSPWRKLDAMQIPRRGAMTTLVLDGLPRSGPFALENGRRALLAARRGARAALDRVVQGGVVRIDVA